MLLACIEQIQLSCSPSLGTLRRCFVPKASCAVKAKLLKHACRTHDGLLPTALLCCERTDARSCMSDACWPMQGIKPELFVDEGGAVLLDGLPPILSNAPVAAVGVAEKVSSCMHALWHGSLMGAALVARELLQPLLSCCICLLEHPCRAAHTWLRCVLQLCYASSMLIVIQNRLSTQQHALRPELSKMPCAVQTLQRSQPVAVRILPACQSCSALEEGMTGVCLCAGIRTRGSCCRRPGRAQQLPPCQP